MQGRANSLSSRRQTGTIAEQSTIKAILIIITIIIVIMILTLQGLETKNMVQEVVEA